MTNTGKASALHELTSADIDAVSGGSLCNFFAGVAIGVAKSGGKNDPEPGGQNDAAQMHKQILQQLTMP